MKTLYLTFLTLLYFGLNHETLAQGPAPAPDDPKGIARIEINNDDGKMHIKGIYEHNLEIIEKLNYRLTTFKESRSGKSKNSQGGSFIALPNKANVLSNVSINVNKKDNYYIKLQVYRDDVLIAQDSVKHED